MRQALRGWQCPGSLRPRCTHSNNQRALREYCIHAAANCPCHSHLLAACSCSLRASKKRASQPGQQAPVPLPLPLQPPLAGPSWLQALSSCFRSLYLRGRVGLKGQMQARGARGHRCKEGMHGPALDEAPPQLWIGAVRLQRQQEAGKLHRSLQVKSVHSCLTSPPRQHASRAARKSYALVLSAKLRENVDEQQG